jgi:uncharacterized protein (DUF1501 family)
MFTRRQFLAHTLKGSSLVALSAIVPQFVSQTARAVGPGKDNILVVLELSGGNDGINTVIPYADDLYHKARPTLRQTRNEVIRLDDHVGLHSGMQGFKPLWEQGQLAVVQGVGYPNPQRSHFESMDIWQSADLKGSITTGWLGRAAAETDNRSGGVPILHIGPNGQPRAVSGAPGGGAVTINSDNRFRLELGGGKAGQQKARRRLLEDLATPASRNAPASRDASAPGADDDPVSFIQRRQLQTLTAVEQLRELLEGPNAVPRQGSGLSQKLQLIAGLIAKGFGTRIFYVNLDGFDTHYAQSLTHRNLLAELADSVSGFFKTLKTSGHDSRVRLMTFSEFGRRVDENGSRGTDHGAASCLFVAGPSVKGGLIGKHPSMAELDAGDLKYHTDFRSTYATLLDGWLGCESKAVLGEKWDHVRELEPKVT